MYHIDNKGRIRVEPGKYEITRMPVSRYEFVADTWKLEDGNVDTYISYFPNQSGTMTGKEPKVEVTIPASKTAMVHYYDKVAYYDKFSDVQEKINTFYSLDKDNSNKLETIKGIRIAEYHVDTTKNTDNADDNDTLTVALLSNTRFKAYMILADGSERLMTDTEKANMILKIIRYKSRMFHAIITRYTR